MGMIFFVKKCLPIQKKVVLLHPLSREKLGVLAQVARAFDWQSKGHRFDSDILHPKRFRRTSFLLPFAKVQINLSDKQKDLHHLLFAGAAGNNILLFREFFESK